MDKRLVRKSVIKTENFLLAHAATLGVSLWAFVCSWVVVPLRTVRDAHHVSKATSSNFLGELSTAYNKNVCELSQTPFETYTRVKEWGKQRLQEYDNKTR